MNVLQDATTSKERHGVVGEGNKENRSVRTYPHLNVQVSRRERLGIWRAKKLSPLVLYVSAKKHNADYRALQGHDI